VFNDQRREMQGVWSLVKDSGSGKYIVLEQGFSSSQEWLLAQLFWNTVCLLLAHTSL
jgi:hypothetical protein